MQTAFVVLTHPIDPDQLVETLRATQPDFELPGVPGVIVPVTALPLRSDGSVDEEALRALPHQGAADAERAEGALKRQAGIEHAAVFVVPRTQSRQPLHVDQLLPAGSGASEHERAPDLTTASDDSHDMATLRAALVSGEPLALQEGQPATLTASLARAMREFPKARILYLNDDGTEEAQSYADLWKEARCIAAGFSAGGIVPGDFVIAQLTQSRDILPFFWGCVLGGFVPLIAATPASYAVASQELEKLGHVWRLLGRPLIVTSADRRQGLIEAGAVFDLDPQRVVSITDLRQHSASGDLHAAQPDDIAFVNLSSGSTGVPKCIQLTHRNVLSRARGTNALCGHEPADVILNWLPFDHIGSISDWHVRCVDLGCDMVYCSKERVLGQPLEWLRIIDRHRISHSWAPNFAYALINAALSGAGSERWDLSSMKSLLTAGEAVSSSTVEELLARLRDHGLRKTAVRTAFGMAELGSGITYSQPTEERPVTAVTVDRASLKGILRDVAIDHPRAITFVSLGPVIAGMSMRIVDDENRILGEKTIGRLHVQGDAVSPGYYANDEANQVFLADGWFETGDQGFIADGQLYLTGRSKDCIIVNGANYFPAEIEKVVEDLPGVEVSFTAAYSVRPPGSQREQVALFFCPTHDRDAELSTLLRAIQQRVSQKIGLKADYLVPISRSDVPKTAIGKIQRKQLAADFEAGRFEEQTRRGDRLLGNERTLPDWFAVPCWRARALRPANLVERAGTPVVLLDDAGLGSRLLDLLGGGAVGIEHGSEPAKLAERHYRADTNDIEQLGAVLEQLGRDLGDLHVIDLRRYGLPPRAWESGAEQEIRRLTRDLQTLMAAIQRARRDGANLRLTVVSNGSQAAGDDDRLCPARCIEPVLLQAAGLEWDWLRASHVDVALVSDAAARDAIARQLVLEFAHEPEDAQVAYRDGLRMVPRLERPALDVRPERSSIRAKGLYVITGGLGGLGAELARMLLARFGARVLLVGKTPLTSGDDARSSRMNALRALGPAEYVALDLAAVGGGAALAAAVADAEARLGAPLAGVFHLAGVFAEGRLSAASEADIWDVLAPKVMGAIAIEELLRDRPDVLLVHFSSAASQFPTATMPAYVAANRFLDAHAHRYRHVLGRQGWALGFSAWTEVGMNAEGASEAVLRSRGLSALTPQQGLCSLQALLARAPGHVLVGIRPDSPAMQRMMLEPVATTCELRGYYTTQAGDLPELIALDVGDPNPLVLRVERLKTVPLTATGGLDRDQLKKQVTGSGGGHVAPEGPVEELLLKIWQNVLKSPSVGATDDFFMLGGHSLLAVELVQRINEMCNTSLPLSVMFEAPTIRTQAELLDRGRHARRQASVIPLQPLGSEPPLFCICGITLYSALARRLAPHVPVYGVLLSTEAELMNGVAVTLNVQDMAREYAAAIRAKQPSGPYRLLGLSFGAVLSYRIAQLLSAEGAAVEILAMIDFVLPSGRSRSLVSSALHKIGKFKQSPDVLRRRARDVGLRALARIAGFTARRPVEAESAGHGHKLGLSAIRFRAYQKAYADYQDRLQPYDGSAMVFRAADQVMWDGFQVAPDCGWSRYVKGEILTFDVPGDHLSMLQEPNVQVLADHLAGMLADRAALRANARG